MFPVIAVVAALGGAIAFAASSVIEQHVTHEVTERRALDPRLLLDLVREPAWVGSIGLNIAGLALQIPHCTSARSRWYSRFSSLN